MDAFQLSTWRNLQELKKLMEDLNIYAWDMTGLTQHLSGKECTKISKAELSNAALGEK